MKKKKIIFDMLLNVIALAVPTVVLQLLILPSLSSYMDGEAYGLLVTILAVLNVLPSTVGNMINNVRILHEEEYLEKRIQGDFQILLLVSEVVNIVVMCLLSFYYLGAGNILSNILLIIVAVLWLSREYHIVCFRLKLNYVDIVINNVILVIGYVVGYLLFKASGYWQFIYIIGFLLSYIHVMIRSNIVLEPIAKTSMLKTVTKDLVYLIIATVLAKAISYADKILLYPILGGTMVSIYYVATIFGKVVSLAITPINSVALSYLSKIKNKPDSIFKWTLLVGSILCAIGYVFALLFSRPILAILYPMYVGEAMKYIYITSATIVVSVLTSMLNPFILRFFDMKWQICINAITVIAYIVISLLLLKLFSLYGFCMGALLTNALKLFITITIYYYCSAKAESKVSA